MTSLLFGLSLAALLSITSLVIILLKVSPLTVPAQAIPAFFLSLFLSIATVGSLLFLTLWRWLPTHSWDAGRIMSVAIRQGIFVALAVVILVLFHLWELLTWWIAILIFLVFGLIELALDQ